MAAFSQHSEGLVQSTQTSPLCASAPVFPTDSCDEQDFGNSWANLTDSSKGRIASFVDFGWGAILKPWHAWKERPKDKTIFATVYEDAHHMKVPRLSNSVRVLSEVCLGFRFDSMCLNRVSEM